MESVKRKSAEELFAEIGCKVMMDSEKWLGYIDEEHNIYIVFDKEKEGYFLFQELPDGTRNFSIGIQMKEHIAIDAQLREFCWI